MTTPLVIHSVKKKIEDFLLGPIDLTLESGTVTALVGNNGAGKSTLLKTIMQMARQDAGDIIIFGSNTKNQDEAWKKQIAYQPQALAACDSFTGNELLRLFSRWYPNWDQRLFEEMITTFEIPLNKKYGKLSQGNQQKLVSALTLARNAELLILDEPTASMDILSKQRYMNFLIKWMEREGKTIFISTHQMEDIRKLADYLIFMNHGQVVGSFEKDQLGRKYKRYWLTEDLPAFAIPGELEREGLRILTSNLPLETETYFQQENMQWHTDKFVDLEDAVTYLLE